MGLIDADLTRDEVSQYITTWKCKDCLKGGGEQFVMAVDDIAYLPTVDAEPVKHARWIETNDATKKRCSGCDVIHLIAQYPHGNANYCPNCGAKMDGGVEDGCKKV